MRILWLSHFVPYPPKGGSFQRSFHLLKRVAARHEVHFLGVLPKRGTHPEAESGQARHELLRFCRSVEILDLSSATSIPGLAWRAASGVLSLTPVTVGIVKSSALRRRIAELRAEHAFDVAHLDSISMAQYLPDMAGLPTVMSHHGAESYMIGRRIRREPNLAKKAFFVGEWLTLERYERRMLPRVADNVVVSDLDRTLLQRIAPNARYTVVDNGVDISFFTPSARPAGRTLIFAGRLNQYSNRDAILHFMREAWPLLRAKHPDVRIDIIGDQPPAALTELAQDDAQVKVHGFVPDVRPFFREASVAICPIRDGGGTRIKVLDALAQGMPLVTTSIGAEGIEVVPDRDVLIADTPEAFARQIGRIFDEPGLDATLSRNGRALVERRYSWDALADVLIDALRRAVGPAAT